MAHVAPTTVLPATSRWLEQLGFTRPLLFTELQLFETLLARTSRCGIYVLHMVDGQYYVGQSVDVVKRLGQHRRRFEAIERISFKPVARTKAQLDLAEIEAIQTLEAAGLPLLNIVHASITYQSSPFDDLMPPAEQRRWLDKPLSLPPVERRIIPDEIRAKSADKYARLLRRPDISKIINVLQQYVASCIAIPHATEPDYWSVSCLPSTNASTWPRIACFNINTMEVFVVGHEKNDPRQIWSFLTVSNVAFTQAYSTDKEFLQAHPGASLEDSGYSAAGHDQVRIQVSSIEQATKLLGDPGITRAARLFNLHLMRKRTNFYARHHCYDLATSLL